MASFSSPPRLPRGLRRRLSLVDCNKTPNNTEKIETKLRFADLRRQAASLKEKINRMFGGEHIQRLSKQQGEGNCIYAEELFNEHKDQFSLV